MTSRLLIQEGYQVLAADCPLRALELASTFEQEIHLVVTDLVMPGLSGPDLACELHARRPGLRCLYISGYPTDIMADACGLDAGAAFLEKPFSPSGLGAAVRAALDL